MRLTALFCILVLASVCSGQRFENNTATAIPDNAPGIRGNIVVSGGPVSILSMRVRVNITHPRINDVGVWLIPPGLSVSPPYTASTMSSSGAYQLAQNLGAGENMTDTQFTGTGDPGFNASGTIYALPSGWPPFTGLFQGPGLQSLRGTNANGTWGLVVFDQVNQQVGTLDNWGIDFALAGINVWPGRMPTSEFAVPLGPDIRVQSFEFVAPSGPQSVLSLATSLIGSAVGTDFSVARLWNDLNLDGYADSYSEPQLDTNRTFSGNAVTFPNVSLNVNNGRAQVLLLLTTNTSAAGKTVRTQLASGSLGVNPGPVAGFGFPIQGPFQNLLGALTLPYAENFDGTLKANVFARFLSGPGVQASGAGEAVSQYIVPGQVAQPRVRVTGSTISSQAPPSSPNHALLEYLIPGSGYEAISSIDFHFNLAAYTPDTSCIGFSFSWASLQENPTAADGVFLSDDGGTTWFGCAYKFPFISNTTLPYRTTALDLSTLALAYGKTAFTSSWVVRIQINGTQNVPNDGLLIDNVACVVAPAGARVREVNASGPLILQASAPSAGRDFGPQLTTAGPTTALTIHVHNSGSQAVTLGTPTCPSVNFVLNNSGFLNSLPGGASTTFTIAFDPVYGGTFVEDVSFTHNATTLTASPFTFQVRGLGVYPNPLEVREQNTAGPIIGYGAAAANGRDFGSQPVTAGATAALTIVVINTGASTWTLGIPALGGSGAASFILNTSGYATSLTPAATTSFTIAFDPVGGGQQPATVSFTHNTSGSGGPPNPFTFGVTGFGTTAPEFYLSDGYSGPGIANGDPPKWGRIFGAQDIFAGPSTAAQVWVFNQGYGTLTFTATLTGADPSEFVISSPGTPVNVPAQSHQLISVQFDPSSIGAKTATLSITHNGTAAAPSPFTCGVSGTGVTTPVIEVHEGASTGPVIPSGGSPSGGRVFGVRDVLLGPTAALTIVITNPGNDNLVLSAPTMTGGASSDFVLNTSGFVLSVPPSGNTSFTVAFDPSTVGAKVEAVLIGHNAVTTQTPSPYAIAVSGTAVQGAAMEIHQGTVSGPPYSSSGGFPWQDFGSQDIAGGPTAAVTLFIFNAGSASLTLSVPALTGANPGEFALNTTGFQTSIAPGSSTSFTVAFDPTLTGLKSCFVQFTHNSVVGWPNPLLIDFQGTGTSTVPLPEIQVRIASVTGTVVTYGSPAYAQLSFGAQDISAGATAAITIVVMNVGNAAMTVGLPSMSGSPTHYLLDTTGYQTSLGVSASTTFTVAFDPTLTGVHNENILIAHNGVNAPTPFYFEVSGQGVAIPVIQVREGSTTGPLIAHASGAAGGRVFGLQDVGAGPSSPVTIVIMNIGTVNLVLNSTITFSPSTGQFVVGGSYAMIIAPGGSTSFTVSFDPSTTGVFNDNFYFTHNAVPYGSSGVTSFYAGVSGQGFSGPVIEVRESSAAGPVISNGAVAGGARNFGSQDVNVGPTAFLTIVVRNIGQGTLTVGTPDLPFVSGYNPNDFVLDTTAFSGSVAAGGQTSFGVAFDPGSFGNKVGLVRFGHSATSVTPSPFEFEVAGTGTGVSSTPVIEVRELAAAGPVIANGAPPAGGRAFSNQLIDAGPTAWLQIFVRNQGTGPLTLGTPVLSGANAAEFVLDASAFAPSVAAGNDTSFSIAFDPTSFGGKTAQVSFTHNAPMTTATPFVINVSGTGVDSVVGAPGGSKQKSEEEGCATSESASPGLRIFVALLILAALGARRRCARTTAKQST